MSKFLYLSLIVGFTSGCFNVNVGGTGGGADGGGTFGTDAGGGGVTFGTGGLPVDNEGVCEFTCVQDAECCLGERPAGAGPCPRACVMGLCVPHACANADDCPLPDMQVCSPVGGVNLCVYPCDVGDDEACYVDHRLGGTSCQRIDDNGNGFCSQFAD